MTDKMNPPANPTNPTVEDFTILRGAPAIAAALGWPVRSVYAALAAQRIEGVSRDGKTYCLPRASLRRLVNGAAGRAAFSARGFYVLGSKLRSWQGKPLSFTLGSLPGRREGRRK